MKDEKIIKRRRKYKFNPKNREFSSRKKKPKKDLKDSLEKLRDYFNDNYHSK